ncbi:hypothetical protein ES703_06390 [subsurface metagenome]
MPERILKITCDECGYSEEVPSSRLAYEEGKWCPKCRKGKMWWVPPAEEARRREFEKMIHEGGAMGEKRISPAVVIVGGLGLGLAAAVGVAALARTWAAPPTLPGRATFYGRVTDAVTGSPISGVLVVLNGMQVFTDAQGNYALTDLEPGSYTIAFGKEGYETVASDIILVEGGNELNVQLTPVPEEGPPVALVRFYMPPEMRKKLTDGTILDMYWNCEVWCDFTNNGDAPGTHNVHIWDSLGNVDFTLEVTLQPGETKTWYRAQWIDFRRISQYSVEAQGDWEENNYSKAVFP